MNILLETTVNSSSKDHFILNDIFSTVKLWEKTGCRYPTVISYMYSKNRYFGVRLLSQSLFCFLSSSLCVSRSLLLTIYFDVSGSFCWKECTAATEYQMEKKKPAFSLHTFPVSTLKALLSLKISIFWKKIGENIQIGYNDHTLNEKVKTEVKKNPNKINIRKMWGGDFTLYLCFKYEKFMALNWVCYTIQLHLNLSPPAF